MKIVFIGAVQFSIHMLKTLLDRLIGGTGVNCDGYIGMDSGKSKVRNPFLRVIN